MARAAIYGPEVWAALKKRYHETPGIAFTELCKVVSAETGYAVPNHNVVRRRASSEQWNFRATVGIKTASKALQNDLKTERRKLLKDKKNQRQNKVVLNEKISDVSTLIPVSENDIETTNPARQNSFEAEVKEVILTHRRNNHLIRALFIEGHNIVRGALDDFRKIDDVLNGSVFDATHEPDPEMIEGIKRRLNMGNAVLGLSKTAFESIKLSFEIDKDLYGLTPDSFIDRDELEAINNAKLQALDQILDQQKEKMATNMRAIFARDMAAMEQRALLPSLELSTSDNDDDDIIDSGDD